MRLRSRPGRRRGRCTSRSRLPYGAARDPHFVRERVDVGCDFRVIVPWPAVRRWRTSIWLAPASNQVPSRRPPRSGGSNHRSCRPENSGVRALLKGIPRRPFRRAVARPGARSPSTARTRASARPRDAGDHPCGRAPIIRRHADTTAKARPARQPRPFTRRVIPSMQHARAAAGAAGA